MHFHIILHEAFESPGAFLNWIDDRGHQVSFTKLYVGETFPKDIQKIDALLIMGGPQSPSTTKLDCPYFDVEQEVAFIARAIKINKHVH